MKAGQEPKPATVLKVKEGNGKGLMSVMLIKQIVKLCIREAIAILTTSDMASIKPVKFLLVNPALETSRERSTLKGKS